MCPKEVCDHLPVRGRALPSKTPLQEPSLGAAWQSSTDTVTEMFSLYHYYCL